MKDNEKETQSETEDRTFDLLSSIPIPFILNKLAENIIIDKPRYYFVREYQRLYDYIKRKNCINFNKLTIREGLQLGFVPDMLDDRYNVFVAPSWIIPLIPEGYPIIMNSNDKPIPLSQKKLEMCHKSSLTIRLMLGDNKDTVKETQGAIDTSLTTTVIPFILNKLTEKIIMEQIISNFIHEWKLFYDYIKRNNCIIFNKLSIEEGKRLGFIKWLWDSRDDVFIIPLWLVPAIPENYPVIITSDSEPVPFSKEMLKNYNETNITIGMKLNKKEGVEKMNIEKTKSNVKTICSNCSHSSVCQYKSKMMVEVQEKVNDINKDLIYPTPIKINVTCNSFKKDKEKMNIDNYYSQNWNFK